MEALRTVVGFVAANALLTAAGTGVLLALGVVRPRLRELFAAGGLAFLCGVSAIMVLGILGLVLGVPLRFSIYAVACLVLAVGGLLLSRWREPLNGTPIDAVLADEPLPKPTRLSRLLGGAALAGLAGLLALSARYYAVLPADAWDEFAMWSKKAVFLFHYDALDPTFFAGAPYQHMHQAYPILLPVLEAFIFRAMGTANTRLIHLEFLVLLVAFLWALWFLVRRRGPLPSWAPLLLGVAASPWIFDQLFTGYADMPLTFLLGVGVLCVGLWLEHPRPARLVLGTLLLGGAANTKMEGLVAGAIVLALAGLLSLAWRRRRQVAHAALALVGFAATILPWRLWIASQDVQVYLDVRRGLDPSFLWESRENALAAAAIMGDQLANEARLSFMVPAALALIVLCLVTGVQRRLAAFYLMAGLMQSAFLIWVYWVEPSSWSPLRTIDTVAIFALVGFLQLATALWPDIKFTHERIVPVGAAPVRERPTQPLLRSTATRD